MTHIKDIFVPNSRATFLYPLLVDNIIFLHRMIATAEYRKIIAEIGPYSLPHFLEVSAEITLALGPRKIPKWRSELLVDASNQKIYTIS